MNWNEIFFPDEMEEERRLRGPRRVYDPDEVAPNMINPFVRDVFAAVMNGDDSESDFDNFRDDSNVISNTEVDHLAREAAKEAWERYLLRRAAAQHDVDESERIDDIGDEDLPVRRTGKFKLRRRDLKPAVRLQEPDGTNYLFVPQTFSGCPRAASGKIDKSWKRQTRQPRQWAARVKGRRVIISKLT